MQDAAELNAQHEQAQKQHRQDEHAHRADGFGKADVVGQLVHLDLCAEVDRVGDAVAVEVVVRGLYDQFVVCAERVHRKSDV